MASRPQDRAAHGYSRLQIVLHWAVAALVLFQFLVNDGMRAAFRERLATGEAALTPGAGAHLAGGILILGLTLVRVGLRIRRGAPPPPPGAPKVMNLLAEAAHLGLYALLLLMALTGAAAWFWRFEAAALVHEIGRLAILGLILAHTMGALVEHYVIGNRVIRRMLRPGAEAVAPGPEPPTPSAIGR